MEAFEKIPFPVFVIDKDHNIVFRNSKAIKVYGEEDPPHDLISKTSYSKGAIRLFKSTEGYKYFYVFVEELGDGLYAEFHVELSDLLSSLEFGRLRPELLMSSGPIVFFLWENSVGWPVKMVSPNVQDMFGYTAEDFLEGKISYADLIHPEDIDRVFKEVVTYSKEKRKFWTHEDYRIITRDGKVKWVQDHTVPVFDSEGNITHYYGYLIDITEKHEKEELLHILAESNPNGVMIYDFKSGEILYANKALERLTGYTAEELKKNSDPLQLIHPKDRQSVMEKIDSRLGGYEGSFSYVVRIMSKEGTVKWVRIISSVITYKGREVSMVTMMDISNEKARERRLEQVAHYDKLTRIYNRRALEGFLDKNIRHAEETGEGFSLLIIDIDNFKHINDTYGHNTGDEVLKGVAKILKNTLRDSDILGRWGGEEFLVILPATYKPAVVGEKLRSAVEKHSIGEVGKVTITVGGTIYVEGDTPASIVNRADTALYRGKKTGKNKVVIIDEL